MNGLVTDALTYGDMTTSPDGEPVEVEDQRAEIIARYGDRDLVAESIREASPRIIESIRRVTSRIAAA